MSLSVLNPLPVAPAPVEPVVQPKPVQPPVPAAVQAPVKADTVSISPAAHQAAADGDHDAS